jgi:hypothetical protein
MADIVAGAWRLQTIWQAFSGLEADFSAGRSSASGLHPCLSRSAFWRICKIL